MRRHVIENAYFAGGARFPPSTVPKSGSSPQTRDASRSTIKTQTAVVNSVTSLFLGKVLFRHFGQTHLVGGRRLGLCCRPPCVSCLRARPRLKARLDELGQNIQMRGACLSGRVCCWMSATHTTAHQNA